MRAAFTLGRVSRRRLKINNLRLRCGHNLLDAEQVYGREHMDRFRRE